MSVYNNYVAILAGGIGSRFWPESRTRYPKQFLDLLGTGKSMLQWTVGRFRDICPKENIFIVTHSSYINLVKEHLPDLPAANIVAEPSRKNTGPAAAYIASKIYKLNSKANLIISPADHLIMDERAFERNVFTALDFVAHHDALLTLGIRPTRPDTGYGYIQYGLEEVSNQVHRVKTFTEKPNLELARTFLKSGDFLWNSGIFVWNVKVFLDALATFLPEIHEVFALADDILNTEEEAVGMEKIYMQCTTVSLDYGIMEKAQNVYVIPSNFGWSDLGTWESIYEFSEKDYLDNAVYGKHIIVVDASGCIIKAPDDKLVLLQGLDNFIVIDTKDALLICERSKEQQIKDYLIEVKRNKGEQFL